MVFLYIHKIALTNKDEAYHFVLFLQMLSELKGDGHCTRLRWTTACRANCQDP